MKQRSKSILDIQDDEKIKCKDCGKKFSLSVGEKAYFEKLDFDPPKRCKECRAKRKGIL